MPSVAVRVFAKVTVGEMQIGIDARHVIFAQTRPVALTHLPRSEGALDGVFNIDGQVVPLVDLRRWMGGATAGDPLVEPAQVMVLRSDGATLGLAVDAVNGLVRLAESSIRQVHHDDAEDGFFHSVGVLDDGSLISLLDPACLMRQTRAWAGNACAEVGLNNNAGRATGVVLGGQARPALTPSQVLVRIGATTLGMDARLVAEVRELPALQRLSLGASVLTDMMEWHGHHVPVLDPGKVLGITRPAQDIGSLVMVLGYEGRFAALPVDGVLAVRQFENTSVQRPEDTGLGADSCFAGVARLEDETPVLLVDGSALLGGYALDGLSDLSTDAAHTATKAGALDPNAYVVFDAGTRWALPMSCLEEITAFPADFRTLPGTDDAAAGSCTWRGRTLPILDIREGGAKELPLETQRLIVVRHRDRVAGLWVNDVIALLPANSVQQSRFSLPGSGPMRMLTTSQAQGRQSYCVLNIDALPFFSKGASSRHGGDSSHV